MNSALCPHAPLPSSMLATSSSPVGVWGGYFSIPVGHSSSGIPLPLPMELRNYYFFKVS